MPFRRRRNVANKMLPTFHQLPMQVAATLILFVACSTSAFTPAYKTSRTAIATVATPPKNPAASSAASNDGEVIGATSLAAAAGAAAAIADGLSMARSSDIDSSSSGNNNDVIAKGANLLLAADQLATGHNVNLTRHHDGDVFRTTGVASCNSDTCVGLSSGTAGLMHLGGTRNEVLGRASLAGGGNGQMELMTRRTGSGGALGGGSESCQCRCLSYLNTYREDLGICVDDVHECTLSPFVSGSSAEKIPFVFLPLRGQIIYPSREISFPDIRTPVCAVTGAQYLTTNGWSDLRNPIDTDYPFRMFRDEGRTFLQWLGETELRQKMQGRLIVVHLVCRDMSLALNSTTKEHIMPPKNVFSPCVAFRVNGSPVKYFHNVSEVLFQSETTSTLASTSDGMTTKEYVVIGVCSLLLGLIYVSSVFLYLHMKKRKNREQNHMRSSLDDPANEINYPKNDQVTFGAPFNRSGSIYSATSLATSNEPRSRASIGSLKEELGIIKNNPLLQHFPQLGDLHSGFASDISNSNSECEMDGGFHDKIKQMQTAALVHPQLGMGSSNGSPNGMRSNDMGNGSHNGDESTEPSASPTQDNECLPAENVSIIEDMMTEEKLENLRAMVNGNIRKKLYFNPAYFEPHLLAQPPQAAIDFLQKIREVIAIAKYKMATKRYQPSLIMIPEESALRSNTPSLYGSQMQTSAECQGCVSNRCSGHVKNCGDKRNSIEKWLQSVTSTDQKSANQQKTSQATKAGQENCQNGGNKSQMKSEIANIRQASPPKTSTSCQDIRPSPPTHAAETRNTSRKEITAPKQRPPPPPTPTSSSNPMTQTSKSSVIEITHSSPSTSHDHNAAYQQYCTSIPVNRNYEAFSALSAAANIYGFAETGSEIYNNPKFTLHDSPAASQRSRSSSHRSKCSRKRLDVLDQYAAASTPTSLTSTDREHYEMLRNMKQMPDMVYDAITRNYNAALMTNGSFQLDIPTPDYDSTIEKKIKDIYNNTQSSAPSVPTPDYSTLSRKSLKQCQPDSPIYRRKSPQYLIVDYETDSLERLEATKRKSSQSSSSPSSDVSSQLSPSLSTALPLEEELEISHTVYDKINGFRKEGDLKKKLLTKSNNGINKQKEIATRIKYDTPFRGSMTIEVEHEPQSDLERSTDSDQFEPDTLDRKPKKQSFCDVSTWSGQLNRSQSNENESDSSRNTHLNNSRSSVIPDMSRQAPVVPATQANGSHPPFVLRASNSFRSQSNQSPTYESHIDMRAAQSSVEAVGEVRPSFGSLRDLYQPQLVRQNSQQSCKCGVQANQNTAEQVDPSSEQGRLLTLEAKHSRRQRLMEPPAATVAPLVEITKLAPNKTTIKISTPKVGRATTQNSQTIDSAVVEPQVHNAICSSPSNLSTTSSSNVNSKSSSSKFYYDLTKNSAAWAISNAHPTPVSTLNSSASTTPLPPKKRVVRSPPPPPPPPTSASTTLTSQRSQASTRHSHHPHYQNQGQYMHISTTATEEETMSNHSQSTEITGVSDTVANSDFGGSCNNTLSSVAQKTECGKRDCSEPDDNTIDSRCDSMKSKLHSENPQKSPEDEKKLKEQPDYGAMFNTQINGLRNDYSLTKYLNRRKSQDLEEEFCNCSPETDSQLETNNNAKNIEADASRFDVLSISSRSNRSSSRLSDRTKEMYRNSGVPVGIAYPQRSTVVSGTGNASTPPTSSVQTVYRCEIEPVQLTHGMQIAMGLKDRAKKAKDLKNAWKKFVSMAAAKFSPTQSPAPPFDKKTPSFLEVLDRDEGISSLIDEHPQVSTPKSSYSAPASQNYYEQRFGVRPQEMDSGYMSADSSEVYKRSFYDRYNFKMMSGRDHIIRVDTIEDNSDGGSTLTDRHNGVEASTRRGNILDSNRFEDFEHMGEPPPASEFVVVDDDHSDADSDKTLTRSDGRRAAKLGADTLNVYSSEDEQGHSPSTGSSETDGETNAEDMWESGAESIETHSVLYKNVRKT